MLWCNVSTIKVSAALWLELHGRKYCVTGIGCQPCVIVLTVNVTLCTHTANKCPSGKIVRNQSIILVHS